MEIPSTFSLVTTGAIVMAELNPCPHCGGEARISQFSYGSGPFDLSIVCEHCKITFKIATGNIADLIKAWNRRKQLHDVDVEEVRNRLRGI